MYIFLLSTFLLAIICIFLIVIIYMIRANVPLPSGPYRWISNASTLAFFLLLPVGLTLVVSYNSNIEGSFLLLVLNYSL